MVGPGESVVSTVSVSFLELYVCVQMCNTLACKNFNFAKKEYKLNSFFSLQKSCQKLEQ